MTNGTYYQRFFSVEERFWQKVQKTETCWLWTGNRNHGGYGCLTIDYRSVKAHRWAYQKLIGPIPLGLELDHLCRVRHCVNPSHLEPVTAQENSRRGLVGAWQLAKVACPQGHLYDEANTYMYKGKRNCRACQHIRNKERQ